MMSHKDWGKIKAEHELQEELGDNALFGEDEDEGESGTSSDAQETQSLDYASYRELEDKLTLAEQKAHENWENLFVLLLRLRIFDDVPSVMLPMRTDIV